MKIAIVDDSAKDLSAETDYLTSYISKNKIGLAMNLKISGFQTSADFLKSFEPGKFDLIALDIVMNDMNGIQLAKKNSRKRQRLRHNFYNKQHGIFNRRLLGFCGRIFYQAAQRSRSRI